VGLAVILYFTWRIGDLVYAPYDPWAAYVHIAAGWSELYEEFLIGTLFLIAALIGSLWLPNNFCRYFCPMGAFLGILSKLSPTRIGRNESTCINCKKCDRVCPAQIDISTQPAVRSPECLACGDCVAQCPVAETLEFKAAGRLTLHWLLYGILAAVLFFGPVWIAERFGYWKTGHTTAAEALTDQTGKKNPANIRGSMSLEVVSREFSVPVEAILTRFNLPADTKPGEMLKNLAAKNNLPTEGFVGGVRKFIAEYAATGGTTAASSPSGPAPAAVPAVAPPAPAGGVKQPPSPGQAVPQKAQPAAPETPGAAAAAAPDIRGRTTVAELLGYGMTRERFKQVTGFDLPADGQMALRDVAAKQGMEMDTLKGKLIEALQRK
jgi:NAD-dependent dihydropyrimidine dehydrogenase PreA subunit